MKHELIMENWRKFVKEEQARMDAEFGGQEVDLAPLSWDYIQEKCLSVWTTNTFKKAMFESVRGLPSVVDLTLTLTKDKDISVMLQLLKSDPETIKLVLSDKEHEPSRDPLSDKPLRAKGTAGVNQTTGQKVVTLYTDAYDLGEFPEYLFDSFKRFQKARRKSYLECLRDGPYSEDGKLKRYPCLSKKALVDSRNLDNFVNLWGFIAMIGISTTLVHELAHTFDPDNPHNIATSKANLRDLYSGHLYDTEPKQEPEERSWPYNTRFANFVRSLNQSKEPEQKKKNMVMNTMLMI